MVFTAVFTAGQRGIVFLPCLLRAFPPRWSGAAMMLDVHPVPTAPSQRGANAGAAADASPVRQINKSPPFCSYQSHCLTSLELSVLRPTSDAHASNSFIMGGVNEHRPDRSDPMVKAQRGKSWGHLFWRGVTGIMRTASFARQKKTMPRNVGHQRWAARRCCTSRLLQVIGGGVIVTGVGWQYN